ncbi:uncharacterized protein BDV14DRAFT_48495 [Aspergillus stella-maris]|uniref:uncharacterized protein n=1 Tax=Aspergillus stella-maris TaxID=1810926 RepID=UPI003CCCB947
MAWISDERHSSMFELMIVNIVYRYLGLHVLYNVWCCLCFLLTRCLVVYQSSISTKAGARVDTSPPRFKNL